MSIFSAPLLNPHPLGYWTSPNELTYPVGVIAANSYQFFTLSIYKCFLLHKAQLNNAGRLRAYGQSTFQSADLARLKGTTPVLEHGVQMDLILEGATPLSFALAQSLIITNLDIFAPTSRTIYFTLNNDSTVALSYTLNLLVTRIADSINQINITG